MIGNKYPNREHENADKTARQQAIAALDAILGDAEILKRRLANGTYTDVSDATSLTSEADAVAHHLAVLDTLRDVREWHAADQAEAAGKPEEPRPVIARAVAGLLGIRDGEQR